MEQEMTNREKFLSTLAPSLADDDKEKILAAYMFAKYGHERQTRDCGQRYFEHPRAVATIIIDELGIADDWRIIVTALLHDILEDSWILDEKRIAINFGKQVARWVSLLTKTPGIDYHEQFSRCAIWQVLLVKLADRLHNVRSLPSCSREKQIRYLEETKKHYVPLAQRLIVLLPKDDKWRGKYLKQQMELCIQNIEGALKTQ